METSVTIRGRQADARIIQSILPNAVEAYKKSCGNEVTVTLDTDNFLPQGTTGGIELYALNGRIRVSISSKIVKINLNYVLVI